MTLALLPYCPTAQAMSDNVTPFRRPKPVRPQQPGGGGFKTHRGKAMLVQFLTLIAFALNFTGAGGVSPIVHE